MIARYKSKPITPVDAVQWEGTNLAEVQTLCPEVVVPEFGTVLLIPTDAGPIEVYVGEMVMKNVAGGKYSKLTGDVFYGLYEPSAMLTRQRRKSK